VRLPSKGDGTGHGHLTMNVCTEGVVGDTISAPTQVAVPGTGVQAQTGCPPDMLRHTGPRTL
jgi:hypothetical protein